MRSIAACAVIAALVCGRAHAADGPFVSMSFQEAQTQAAKENKLIFIDFFTTWCGPCKIMDRTTFANEKVIKWLAAHTIALRIDAERHAKLAQKYSVNFYPTMIFCNPEGTELARLMGLQGPDELLSTAADIQRGKSPLERARKELVAAGKDKPGARMKYANALARAGKDAEALAEYLWCFDEGARHDPSFSSVRRSYLVSEIAALGERYPPALEALRQRRDAARERVLHEDPDAASRLRPPDDPAADFAVLNRELGEQQDTLRVYDKLRKEHPDWPVVDRLQQRVFEQLVQAHRYTEIADSMDIEQEIERQFKLRDKARATVPEADRPQFDRNLSEVLLDELGSYYEMLVGLHRDEAAARVAAKALAISDSANVYNMLAWHGYLTGYPTETNLAQARKAYDLSGGKDAAIVDTLVRILARRGSRAEACELLRQAVKRFTAGPDHEIIARCTADLDCPDAG